MFAPKDEKAKFRVGSKVTFDFHPGVVYKVVKKYWDANGTMYYTLGDFSGQAMVTYVRQKDLNKA